MTTASDYSENVAAVRTLWKTCSATEDLCLCVSGSVARGEQTPHSDTDFLLLHKDNDTASAAAEDMLRRMHAELEHVSVISRSLAHCRAMIDEDVRSWVSQMDATWVVGSKDLFMAYRTDMCSQAEQSHRNLLTDVYALTMERHRQYGETLALLEPNIKNSAGALRDIHTMYYISLLERVHTLDCRNNPWPSVVDALRELQLQSARKNQLIDAYQFLLATRAAMHACSGHLHDTLDFDLQQCVAAYLKYGTEKDKQGVESFMRDYYQHAHTVYVALQLVFTDQQLGNGQGIRCENASGQCSGEDVIELFLRSCSSGTIVDISLVRVLDANEDMQFTSRACREMFDAILHHRRHVYATLSRMHEMRILGKVLPEFSGLAQYFQHNIYHFFTADEHTLRCIRSCEALNDSEEHVAGVFRDIKDISTLYYALLLHDIAKPRDLQRHEIVGAAMAEEILRRYRRSDILEDVRFLVREHLSMEQLAFRRNFRDRATLAPFAERVSTLPRLELLYVLTYADMSALNPGVLTDWKKDLLAELYEETKRFLLSDDKDREPSSSKLSIVEPVSSMDHHGFQTAVQDILEGERMRMHVMHHRGYSEVTVFCVDRPQLLSSLSAAFFAADTSIVDAAIETRNDVVIDMFRVVDIISGKHISTEQTHKLREYVRSVCAGDLDVEDMYTRGRRKWIRRLRKMPRRNIKTAVEYIPHTTTDGARQTIIEVYAPDTFGLLYRLAAEISLFGLNVVFAKIATRVDGVVDSFYVIDEAGQPLVDITRQEALRTRLLRQITALTE